MPPPPNRPPAINNGEALLCGWSPTSNPAVPGEDEYEEAPPIPLNVAVSSDKDKQLEQVKLAALATRDAERELARLERERETFLKQQQQQQQAKSVKAKLGGKMGLPRPPPASATAGTAVMGKTSNQDINRFEIKNLQGNEEIVEGEEGNEDESEEDLSTMTDSEDASYSTYDDNTTLSSHWSTPTSNSSPSAAVAGVTATATAQSSKYAMMNRYHQAQQSPSLSRNNRPWQRSGSPSELKEPILEEGLVVSDDEEDDSACNSACNSEQQDYCLDCHQSTRVCTCSTDKEPLLTVARREVQALQNNSSHGKQPPNWSTLLQPPAKPTTSTTSLLGSSSDVTLPISNLKSGNDVDTAVPVYSSTNLDLESNDDSKNNVQPTYGRREEMMVATAVAAQEISDKLPKKSSPKSVADAPIDPPIIRRETVLQQSFKSGVQLTSSSTTTSDSSAVIQRRLQRYNNNSSDDDDDDDGVGGVGDVGEVAGVEYIGRDENDNHHDNHQDNYNDNHHDDNDDDDDSRLNDEDLTLTLEDEEDILERTTLDSYDEGGDEGVPMLVSNLFSPSANTSTLSSSNTSPGESTMSPSTIGTLPDEETSLDNTPETLKRKKTILKEYWKQKEQEANQQRQLGMRLGSQYYHSPSNGKDGESVVDSVVVDVDSVVVVDGDSDVVRSVVVEDSVLVQSAIGHAENTVLNSYESTILVADGDAAAGGCGNISARSSFSTADGKFLAGVSNITPSSSTPSTPTRKANPPPTANPTTPVGQQFLIPTPARFRKTENTDAVSISNSSKANSGKYSVKSSQSSNSGNKKPGSLMAVKITNIFDTALSVSSNTSSDYGKPMIIHRDDPMPESPPTPAPSSTSTALPMETALLMTFDTAAMQQLASPAPETLSATDPDVTSEPSDIAMADETSWQSTEGTSTHTSSSATSESGWSTGKSNSDSNQKELIVDFNRSEGRFYMDSMDEDNAKLDAPRITAESSPPDAPRITTSSFRALSRSIPRLNNLANGTPESDDAVVGDSVGGGSSSLTSGDISSNNHNSSSSQGMMGSHSGSSQAPPQSSSGSESRTTYDSSSFTPSDIDTLTLTTTTTETTTTLNDSSLSTTQDSTTITTDTTSGDSQTPQTTSAVILHRFGALRRQRLQHTTESLSASQSNSQSLASTSSSNTSTLPHNSDNNLTTSITSSSSSSGPHTSSSSSNSSGLLHRLDNLTQAFTFSRLYQQKQNHYDDPNESSSSEEHEANNTFHSQNTTASSSHNTNTTTSSSGHSSPRSTSPPSSSPPSSSPPSSSPPSSSPRSTSPRSTSHGSTSPGSTSPRSGSMPSHTSSSKSHPSRIDEGSNEDDDTDCHHRDDDVSEDLEQADGRNIDANYNVPIRSSHRQGGVVYRDDEDDQLSNSVVSETNSSHKPTHPLAMNMNRLLAKNEADEYYGGTTNRGFWAKHRYKYRKDPIYRHYINYALTTLLVALIAVFTILIISVSIAHNQDNSATNPPTSDREQTDPTYVRPPNYNYVAPQTSQEANLRETFRPISFDAVDDSNSPQYAAILWLANTDTFVTTDSLLTQRYVMALIYFATAGSQWTRCGATAYTPTTANSVNTVNTANTAPSSSSSCLDEYGRAQIPFLSPSTHECQWYGVRCNPSNQVTSLIIKENNLQGTIPHELGSTLTQLVHWVWSKNYISGYIPNSVANMSNLKTLMLNRNDLVSSSTGIPIPTALTTLMATTLTTLALGENSLSGTLSPDTFPSSCQLQYLDLGDNALQGMIPDSLFQCSQLRKIDLQGNQFRGTVVPQFGTDLPELELLMLGNNLLTGTLPSDLFRPNSKLYHFDVKINNLQGTLPETLFDNVQLLQTLDLGTNNFSGPLSANFSKLSQLRELYLWMNKFEGTVPSELGAIQTLELFYFTYNNLTGTVPASLCTLRESGSLDFLSADCKAKTTDGEPKITCYCCTLCLQGY